MKFETSNPRREAMQKSGVTIKELAKKSGYSMSTIERAISTGEATYQLGWALSRYIGCKFDLFY